MIALTSTQWVLVALMVAFYVILCGRTALYMARSGRSFWKWLVITLFLTSIPATLVAMRERQRALRSPRRRRFGPPLDEAPFSCARCGKQIRAADLDTGDGVAKCPHCGLPVDEDQLA